MMNRKFKFYVPGRSGHALILDKQTEQANRVIDEFATMFGGATVTHATGIYKDGTGKLVKEPIVQVESFTDDSGHWEHVDEVYALAEDVCKVMNQESVALEDDDMLVLVQVKKVQEERIAA